MKRRKFLQSSAAAGTVALLGSCGQEPFLSGRKDDRYIDAEDLEPGSLIEGDICIVGAGAAGICMALELAGSGLQVILLEAGGMRYEPESQEQYRGEIVGESYFPLEAARLRYFGGTTGHWSGFCAPFDEIDFENREWVPDSTWPIDLDDLHPYYARAHGPLELGPYEYGVDYWTAQKAGLNRLPFGANFWSKMWQFSAPIRMGVTHREALLSASNIHIYTHATVCEVNANESVSAVESLRIRTLAGDEHTARAKHYILACGAIQNARLLLASNSRAIHGIGNDGDLVGRYFMEHIEVPGANVIFNAPQSLRLYTAPPRKTGAATPARAEIALSGEIQRRERVLNGTAQIQGGRWSTSPKSTFQYETPEWLERRRREEERGRGPEDRNPPPPMDPRREFRLKTRQEQAPNPESRVMLSDDRDALGMPRVKLQWKLTELDQQSIRRFYELLGEELERTGLGRLELTDWLVDGDDSDWPNFLSGGWHHMGTTKMHDDPKQGVVDANCRVHGVENLHIAGSAAFSTAGAANPTLTLVALSIRLADRVKSLVV